MRGPDPSELQNDTKLSVNDEEFTFNGVNGLGYQDFLQKIRCIAFNEGKSRDNTWVADLAVLHLSDEALTWFETLSDDVQGDWGKLRRAIIQKYGAQDDELVTSQARPPQVMEAATANETGNPENGATPQIDPLLPARIPIANWDSPVHVSTISFPRSEEDWINQGRQRKGKYGGDRSLVYWHLVEPSDPAPDNAIPTGSELGVTFYSIRAWHEGGLALGKLATQTLFWRSKRAYIIWDGREILWSGPFEVLVGDRSSVRWIKPQSSGPFEAVEGGFEIEKTKALLVAHFDLGRMTQPGKVFSGASHGSYGWWWLNEVCQENFHVLAWHDDGGRHSR
ncbi:hypothetical protein FRC01_002652 [Tulasnella sp. 417]|nr:hypothetical protein FRC01_002652 [Tulasnella sp. 417]